MNDAETDPVDLEAVPGVASRDHAYGCPGLVGALPGILAPPGQPGGSHAPLLHPDGRDPHRNPAEPGLSPGLPPFVPFLYHLGSGH